MSLWAVLHINQSTIAEVIAIANEDQKNNVSAVVIAFINLQQREASMASAELVQHHLKLFDDQSKA